MTTRRVDDETIARALAGLPGWRREGSEIRCEYRFATFAAAVAFTLRIAALAEERDHHPEWTVRYRRVEVATTTHDASGLTALDLALAEGIADVAAELDAETPARDGPQ